ncbi:hypothetical protein ACHAXN_006421 [Cyclotella atomus]
MALPQHIQNALQQPYKRQTMLAFVSLLVVPSRALSVAAPSRSTPLYQPRLVSDLRSESLSSRRNALLSSIAPSLDNEAWLAALFEEEVSTGARGARFEESLSDQIIKVSVKDATKPGSLVQEVQDAKGADIDPETVLKMEAQKRQSSSDGLVTASSKNTAGRVNPLTKEYEYTLAAAIQSGVRVHKLKAEYESTNSRPLSKKKWAALAGMDSSQLRRTIADYRSAKQELVSSNMGLVHAISRDFQHRPQYKDLTLDELIQEGSLGLIRAAELFDPARNLRFSTYATIWIKGAIQNQRIGQFVILPNQENKRWGEIRAAMRDLEKEGMKSDKITTKVIADRLGIDEKKVDANIKSMTSVSKVLSLDYKYNSRSRSGESDGEESNEAFLLEADLAETTHMRADLISALVANLSEREIQLIRLVYGLDGKEHKINAAARIMGMNKETCRLLHKTVLNKLKQAKEMESLQEYLLTVA